MENGTLRQESRDKLRELLNKADGVDETLTPKEVEGLQDEIKDLEQAVEELEAEVKSLEADLESLRNKQVSEIPTYTLPAEEVVNLVRENINKLTRHHMLLEEFIQLLD